jgi:hypothetical protein
MYGGGPDKDAAEQKAASLELDMPFHGPLDHAELDYTQSWTIRTKSLSIRPHRKYCAQSFGRYSTTLAPSSSRSGVAVQWNNSKQNAQ